MDFRRLTSFLGFLGLVVLAWPFKTTSASAADLLLSDYFEGPGYGAMYTEPDIVQPGNFLSPDAPTAWLGHPEGWGEEFLLMHLGSQFGGALSRTQLPAPATAVYSSLEFIVLHDELKPGGVISLAVMKETHNDPGVEVTRETPIDLLRIYRLDAVYDVKSGFYAFFLNGSPLVQGVIPGVYPRAVNWIVVGSSASSSGRGITVGIDRFIHWGF